MTDMNAKPRFRCPVCQGIFWYENFKRILKPVGPWPVSELVLACPVCGHEEHVMYWDRQVSAFIDRKQEVWKKIRKLQKAGGPESSIKQLMGTLEQLDKWLMRKEEQLKKIYGDKRYEQGKDLSAEDQDA